MFRRKNNSLPTTSLSLPAGDTGGGFLSMSSSHGPDGSGKAIKMDAPVVKAWKTASSFTRGSYYVLGFFIFLVFVGARWLTSSNASIWMNCHAEECKLQITPPGSRTVTLDFARGQLLSAHGIKTNNEGDFLKFDTDKYNPSQRGKNKYSKTKNSYKGADEFGEYRSYAIKFKASTKSSDEGETEKSEDDVPDGDFTTISQFLSPGEEEGTYMLYMRKFGMTHSKTRVRSMINKVESYVKKRRQKLVLKETVTVAWQGILSLVLGLMGIMMTLLIGQFWEDPVKKQGGPGIRRGAPVPKKKVAGKDSKYYVDTGRQSKYPPGYKKY